MSITFKQLKSRKNDDFARLNAQLKAINEPSFKDPDADTFWELVTDKAGNGYAILRLLPAPKVDLLRDKEAAPFVRWWSHGFKGPGGWYIEKSLTTLGQPDPCSEMNKKFWESGDEKLKAFVSGNPNVKPAIAGSKRKENFACGIYVVKHDGRPSDVGKFFRFKFGKKIFQKINDAFNPKNPTKSPVNAFDLIEGANFVLVAGKNDGGFRGYDDSSFAEPSPLFETEAEMEKLWENAYSLADLVAPSKFKTYEQLNTRLKLIMGTKLESTTVEDKPELVSRSAPTHKEETPPFDLDDDDDTDLSGFKSLIESK